MQHSGVAPIQRLLQGRLHGPALTAIQENGLHGRVKEVKLDFTWKVGLPSTGHAIQSLPCKSLPQLLVLLRVVDL